MSLAVSQRIVRREDRRQHIKLRLAQAEQRAAMANQPVCEHCGKRHPPHPLAALFGHLEGEVVESGPVVITSPKEPPRGCH
jgi:ribosomal protein L32